MNERHLFIAARQLDSAQRRRAFLKKACGADAQLYARVNELLQAEEQAVGFLQQPAVAIAPAARRGSDGTARTQLQGDPVSGEATTISLDFLTSSRLPGSLGCMGQYEPGSGMHRLWFSTGGSAGHSSLVGLDVFEGVYDPQRAQSRVWNVSVLKPKDVIAAEQNRKEEAKERNAEDKSKARQERGRRRMAFALSHSPEGDTLTGLADRAGLSRSKAKEAIEVLVERGVAVACKVAKGRGSRELDGFKLAPQDQDD